MEKLRHITVFLITMLLTTVLLTESAFAQNVTCNSSGGMDTTTGFIDTSVVSTSNCTVANENEIFSRLACNFISIINDVFGHFYCGIQYALERILPTVLVLYLAVFGIGIMIGTQDLNAGNVILTLFKIGAIVAITTNSVVGVGLIYSFFVSLVIEGVDWALSALDFCGGNCGNGLRDVFSSIDSKIYELFLGNNGFFSGDGELVLFFFMIVTLVPPIFYMVVSVLWMVFSVFVRSMVSFLMSITAIAFLIALSPVFLSFVLFRSTRSMFDSWIRFLTAYTIEPMLVFMILALWVNVSGGFLDFVQQLSNVIEYRKTPLDKGAIATDKDGIVFCRPIYNDRNPGVGISSVSFSILGFFSIPLPTLNFTPGGPTIELVDLNGNGKKDNGGCCSVLGSKMTNVGPVITCDSSASSVDIGLINDDDKVIPSVMIRDREFIYFLAYHLITMLIISYAFVNMLLMAPVIASEISVSRSPAPLGVGFGSSRSGITRMVSGITDTSRNLVGRVGNRTAGSMAKSLNNMASGRAKVK
ncbi:MAG: type IV secretion system protein [Rickettsiales bacterium]